MKYVIKVVEKEEFKTPLVEKVILKKPKPLKNIYISNIEDKYAKDLNEARRFDSYEECKQFADKLILEIYQTYKLTQVVF